MENQLLSIQEKVHKYIQRGGRLHSPWKTEIRRAVLPNTRRLTMNTSIY